MVKRRDEFLEIIEEVMSEHGGGVETVSATRL